MGAADWWSFLWVQPTLHQRFLGTYSKVRNETMADMSEYNFKTFIMNTFIATDGFGNNNIGSFVLRVGWLPRFEKQ